MGDLGYMPDEGIQIAKLVFKKRRGIWEIKMWKIRQCETESYTRSCASGVGTAKLEVRLDSYSSVKTIPAFS